MNLNYYIDIVSHKHYIKAFITESNSNLVILHKFDITKCYPSNSINGYILLDTPLPDTELDDWEQLIPMLDKFFASVSELKGIRTPYRQKKRKRP